MEKMKTENLKLAQIRYFETKRNATEIPMNPAYVILFHQEGEYMNVFCPGEELPVYERAPYGNCTLNGDNYGNLLYLASGEVQEGPCFVVEPFRMKDILRKEEVSMSELEDFVMTSDYFFVDRISLLEKKEGSFLSRMKNRKKIQEDQTKKEQLDSYFASFGTGLMYRK